MLHLRHAARRLGAARWFSLPEPPVPVPFSEAVQALSPLRQQSRRFSAGRQTLVMPALSPTMEAGTIAAWHKGEGDYVEEGDTLADVDTDKASISWEHMGEEGYVSKILVPAGGEAPVGKSSFA